MALLTITHLLQENVVKLLERGDNCQPTIESAAFDITNGINLLDEIVKVGTFIIKVEDIFTAFSYDLQHAFAVLVASHCSSSYLMPNINQATMILIHTLILNLLDNDRAPKI